MHVWALFLIINLFVFVYGHVGNGVARNLVFGGGHPVHFPSSLREPTAFSGGGGSSRYFPSSQLPDQTQWGGGG